MAYNKIKAVLFTLPASCNNFDIRLLLSHCMPTVVEEKTAINTKYILTLPALITLSKGKECLDIDQFSDTRTSTLAIQRKNVREKIMGLLFFNREKESESERARGFARFNFCKIRLPNMPVPTKLSQNN